MDSTCFFLKNIKYKELLDILAKIQKVADDGALSKIDVFFLWNISF